MMKLNVANNKMFLPRKLGIYNDVSNNWNIKQQSKNVQRKNRNVVVTSGAPTEYAEVHCYIAVQKKVHSIIVGSLVITSLPLASLFSKGNDFLFACSCIIVLMSN